MKTLAWALALLCLVNLAIFLRLAHLHRRCAALLAELREAKQRALALLVAVRRSNRELW